MYNLIKIVQANIKIKRLLFVLFICSQVTTSAQNNGKPGEMPLPSVSPVIIESMFGNNGLNLQTISSKTFTPSSRFGIFGVTDLYGVYNAKEQAIKNQQMAQTHLTYELAKGLNLSAGAFFETHSGFRPTVGLLYNLFAGDFHFLLAPRIDLSQTYNIEIPGFVEYTPKINEDWKIYSRAQGMYNKDLKNNIHSISYGWGRVGVSYRNYRFGAGSNFYWLGPEKIIEKNYGLFLGVLLF